MRRSLIAKRNVVLLVRQRDMCIIARQRPFLGFSRSATPDLPES